jgi:hypothetical protein
MENTNNPVIGKLRWFDAMRGEGMVEVNNESFYLHFTAIVGIDKNNYHYPTKTDQILLENLNNGDPCKVTIYENMYLKQIDTCNFDFSTNE